MDGILSGTIWRMISPLLTNDDVARCRTVTSRWNVGGRHGEMGEFYFSLQHNDPYEKHWHYDSDDNKTHTMLKKNSPLMEGPRKWGLHDPRDVPSWSGEKTLEQSSFENAVMSLAGFQIAGEKIQQGCSTKGLRQESGRH